MIEVQATGRNLDKYSTSEVDRSVSEHYSETSENKCCSMDSYHIHNKVGEKPPHD